MSSKPQGDQLIHIAYVISPHGFGHAARACAVMDAVLKMRPDVIFDVMTLVPEWFFKDSLGRGYSYLAFETDIGVVQEGPFQENLAATVAKIKTFLPFDGLASDKLANHMVSRGCVLAICDAGPLGIRAAQKAGIPSLLIENFTWDWIYSGYLEVEPDFAGVLEDYRQAFRVANYRIQTQPVCALAECNLSVPPVARTPHHTKSEVRSSLSIDGNRPVVLITMGGIHQAYRALSELSHSEDYVFVIPGGAEEFRIERNLVMMPHHSDFYHPDLVYASDAVVGKLGYSTVAEAALAGIRYAYVPRDNFRETGPLGTFVEQYLSGMAIQKDDFFSGEWVNQLPGWMQGPAPKAHFQNGADQVARFVLEKAIR